MEKVKSGKRTLLMSVLMSSPGPIVVGLGLMMGKSSTQLADFVRRSAELAAIIVSYIVYCISSSEKYRDTERKIRLETIANGCVGAAMCLGGAAMIFIALFAPSAEKGNVIPGLCIALMGLVANTLFWRKYTKLSREGGSTILAVQSGLYRAKSLVDGCVTLALLSVLILPGTKFSYYLDIAGSVIVAIYLIWTGFGTLKSTLSRKGTS